MWLGVLVFVVFAELGDEVFEAQEETLLEIEPKGRNKNASFNDLQHCEYNFSLFVEVHHVLVRICGEWVEHLPRSVAPLVRAVDEVAEVASDARVVAVVGVPAHRTSCKGKN